jgi:hypothetical protein
MSYTFILLLSMPFTSSKFVIVLGILVLIMLVAMFTIKSFKQ